MSLPLLSHERQRFSNICDAHIRNGRGDTLRINGGLVGRLFHFPSFSLVFFFFACCFLSLSLLFVFFFFYSKCLFHSILYIPEFFFCEEGEEMILKKKSECGRLFLFLFSKRSICCLCFLNFKSLRVFNQRANAHTRRLGTGLKKEIIRLRRRR